MATTPHLSHVHRELPIPFAARIYWLTLPRFARGSAKRIHPGRGDRLVQLAVGACSLALILALKRFKRIPRILESN